MYAYSSTGGLRILKLALIIVIFMVVESAGLALAQETSFDINALTNETQKKVTTDKEMTFLWWIPEEYWEASFSKNKNMTAVQVESFLKVLRPYILILAVDGKVGSMGGVTYTPETTLRNIIQVIDDQGTRYRPLNDDKIDADVTNLLSMIKPIFVNMLGPLGENLHAYLFSSKNDKGQGIAVADEEGRFSVELNGRKFKWELPLGSLIPKQVCPKGGELLNGNWNYCPWHGVKLN